MPHHNFEHTCHSKPNYVLLFYTIKYVAKKIGTKVIFRSVFYMIYMYMYLSRSQAIGAVAIGLGIWVLVEEPDVLELSSLRELTVMDQSYLLTSVYLIITAGAAILVFGIVGMVATNAQSACCLGFVSIRSVKWW